MLTSLYPYTLNDLLCLKKSGEPLYPLVREDYDKKVLEWAEAQVMAGDESEALLIFASLNQDKIQDDRALKRYLDADRHEAGLNYPDKRTSALTCLKIQLWNLVHCEDARIAETLLYGFAAAFLNSPPGFFARACRYLSWLYYHLYDDLGGEYQTLASETSADETLSYIKKYITPVYRKLKNDDWLNVILS
ncbi:hypothetical protein JGL56_12820 [Salmonella enterica subsp. enterica serovar Derby]|nr:hypothetical protein [Salmonella enterica subsp. enterica serovar Derby]RAY99574.1 hypothetical protein DP187_13290 [Enterobacter cloacae]